MASCRSAVVALLVVALVVAAASLPAASAYGCYDDCYERCANGKEDPACTTMCDEACGVVDKLKEASKPVRIGSATDPTAAAAAVPSA